MALPNFEFHFLILSRIVLILSRIRLLHFFISNIKLDDISSKTLQIDDRRWGWLLVGVDWVEDSIRQPKVPKPNNPKPKEPKTPNPIFKSNFDGLSRLCSKQISNLGSIKTRTLARCSIRRREIRCDDWRVDSLYQFFLLKFRFWLEKWGWFRLRFRVLSFLNCGS